MIQIFSEFQAIRNVDTVDWRLFRVWNIVGAAIYVDKTAGLVKKPERRACYWFLSG